MRMMGYAGAVIKKLPEFILMIQLVTHEVECLIYTFLI